MYYWNNFENGSVGNTMYGEGHPNRNPAMLFGYGTPGDGGLRKYGGLANGYCTDLGDDNIYNEYMPGYFCSDAGEWPWTSKARLGINIISCCPGDDDKITSGWGSGSFATGRYKMCNSRPKTYPKFYVPYTVDHVTFPNITDRPFY
jgi:hypothetical protein